MNGDTQRSDSTTRGETAPAEPDPRLESLESRLAYQEHWLDTLDAAMAGQERRLSQLERINALLQTKLREQQRQLQENAAATPRPEDEVPPHY